MDFNNSPQQPESYSAIRLLAVRVLDPLVDTFGHLKRERSAKAG